MTKLSGPPLPAAVKPLVRNRFVAPSGEVVFTAACFEGDNWSLGPLQWPEDVEKNPELSGRLAEALLGIRANTAFAPNPTAFNGKVIDPPSLNRMLKLRNGSVYLHRNQDHPGDATFLRYPRTAGIFSAGGCGVVVLIYKSNLLFGHAGRESLLDRRRVETEGVEEGRRRDLIDHELVPHDDVVDDVGLRRVIGRVVLVIVLGRVEHRAAVAAVAHRLAQGGEIELVIVVSGVREKGTVLHPLEVLDAEYHRVARALTELCRG